jgi:hypothetical protein
MKEVWAVEIAGSLLVRAQAFRRARFGAGTLEHRRSPPWAEQMNPDIP